MEADPKYRLKLFAGWMASSALILGMLMLLTPAVLDQSFDIAFITIIILYIIILFIWLVPFLVLRALLAKLGESRQRKAA